MTKKTTSPRRIRVTVMTAAEKAVLDAAKAAAAGPRTMREAGMLALYGNKDGRR